MPHELLVKVNKNVWETNFVNGKVCTNDSYNYLENIFNLTSKISI